MKRILFMICLLFPFQQSSFSQDKLLIDSLEQQLKNRKAIKLKLGKQTPSMDDTLVINILTQLSNAYSGNNSGKAMDHANHAMALSKQIGFKQGIGNAYNVMGVISQKKGDYLPALELLKNAQKISKELGYKKGLASSYNDIGSIYYFLGNYPEALKSFYASLKISEQRGHKSGITRAYNNLGAIYFRQENYPEALKNFSASLKISEEIGDKPCLASDYNNIGATYYLQGNKPEALRNYLASLKVAEETGNKQALANAYNNIGNIYKDQGKHDEELWNYFSSLKIYEEIGDRNGIANAYNNIGNAYTKHKNYHKASLYLTKALLLSKEIGVLKDIENIYKDISTLDSARGNFKQALGHYKKYITTRDSIVNKENTKKMVQTQMQYEFDKKESLAKAEQEKKDAVAQKELQKQKLVRNGFVGGFVVVLLFAGVFFTQRNKIKKGKKRSDELLLNILPAEVAEELKTKGSADAKQIDDVTVLFTDFKGFTQLSEKLSPKELVAEINECFSAFDYIMLKHGVEKIKTIGDSYMAAGGLPTPNNSHASDVVRAALDIQQYIKDHKAKKEAAGQLFFEIRIGVHTGPVVAGIVGVKKFAYDIWGDTVNTASRMESSGEAGQVNISGTTYELIKDKFKCNHRGKIQAKNKGEIDMYFVSEQ